VSSLSIKKIRVKVGDKEIGSIDMAEGLSEAQQEELLWNAILSTVIVYRKGQTAEISLGGAYKRKFIVKESFVFHGFRENKVLVTIPITLDTLKGLGFIKSLKGRS